MRECVCVLSITMYVTCICEQLLDVFHFISDVHPGKLSVPQERDSVDRRFGFWSRENFIFIQTNDVRGLENLTTLI